MTQQRRIIIKNLLKQFGDDVQIKFIAGYAEAEFGIPYKEAVEMIYDATDSEV